MAGKRKPQKGTYRVTANTGRPMDFATKARAKKVAGQLQGGKVSKNGGGCAIVALGAIGTAIAAAGTAVTYVL